MAKVRLGVHGVRNAEDVLADHADRLETLERRSIEPDVEPRRASGGGDGFVSEYTVTLQGSPGQYPLAPQIAHYVHPQGARITDVAIWVEQGLGSVRFSTPNAPAFLQLETSSWDGDWVFGTAPPGVLLAANTPELIVETFGADSSPILLVQVRFEPLDGGGVT